MAERVPGLSDDEGEDCDVQEDNHKSSKKSNKTDLMKMTGNLLSNINYKVAFLLFVVSVVIFSDVFIDNVLHGIDGAIEGDSTTTKGTMVQLIFMIVSYIFIDLIVQYEVL